METFEGDDFPLGWVLDNGGFAPNWEIEDNMMRYVAGFMGTGGWALTPGLYLSAGTEYFIEFDQKMAHAGTTGKLLVSAGNVQAVEEQLWLLFNDDELTNTTWATHGVYFTPQVTDIYYLGFQCYSNEGILYVDNLTVNFISPNAETPVITPVSGLYFEPVTVNISCATENAQIYYTLDGSDPDDLAALYTEPFTVSEITTVKAIAYAENHDPSLINTVNYNFPITVANLTELRSQTPGQGTVFYVTGEVVVSFKQSNSSRIYVQDENAGILVDDVSGVFNSIYTNGDGITGLNGIISLNNGMLQIVPSVFPGEASSSNNV